MIKPGMIYSTFLVIIQLSSISFIIFTGKIIPANPILLIIFIFAFLFGIWAMSEMKFRFSIFPGLLKNSTLVTSGPFKVVRNPIYTSLLFMTLIWLINDSSTIRIIVWFILLIVLNIKIYLEENILKKEFPDYIYYSKNTKKLIPFLY